MVLPLSVSPDTPIYVAIILNFTIELCNYIRFIAVNLVGNELENISDWLLEIFQSTDNSPQYAINACQVFYLLCALGKSVGNSWSNYNSTLESLENNPGHGILSNLVPSLLQSGGVKEKPFTFYDRFIHTLKLLAGIAFALALQNALPYVIFQAYSENSGDAFIDEASYFARFFSLSKYSAFLLANTASSIYWLWASCLYVSPDVPFKYVTVPLVYIIKALLFFVVRRIFRNCWNPDVSTVGYYAQLYLSPYTEYPCILLSLGVLIFIVGIIGAPNPSLIGRIKIPSALLFVTLSIVGAIFINDVNFLPRTLFETLRSDIASSGSYILALYFFPFNYNGDLSSFTFCMLTFLMFMETGVRSASSSFQSPLNSWSEVFDSISEYFMRVFSSIANIERYPISIFAIGLYLLKKYVPTSNPSASTLQIQQPSVWSKLRRGPKLKSE